MHFSATNLDHSTWVEFGRRRRVANRDDRVIYTTKRAVCSFGSHQLPLDTFVSFQRASPD